MIAPSHPSWDPRVAMKESHSLSRKGHKVALIAMYDPEKECPNGIEILPLEHKHQSRWDRIKQLPKIYRIARSWPADVYHVHEPESLLIGILLKFQTDAKLVFDSHECFQYTAARGLRGWKALVVTAVASKIMKWLARCADYVIVVSYSSEKFYRNYCKCVNVEIIHNSPLPDKFPCMDKTQEALKTIVHNGFIPPDRGIENVIRAIKLVSDKKPVRFLIIGFRNPSEHTRIQTYVNSLNLNNVVEIVPWLEYGRLGVELNRGSIGVVAVQPTKNNLHTLHNKLFNYMSAGLAVIGPLNSDTAAVIRRYDCGISVDTTDANALVTAIERLLVSSEECYRYGMNGRRAIEHDLGWHKMEERLESIYDRIK